MSISIASLAFGLLIILIALLVARLLKKGWQRNLAVALGAVFAVGVVLVPAIAAFINQPRAPQDTEILQLLYGSDTPIQTEPDGETVYIVEELTDVEREQFSYAAQVNTSVVDKLMGWNNNPNKVLVLTRTGPPACCDRSQLPILGGAVLALEEGAWRVEVHQKLITPFGSFPSFSSGRLVEIGPQKTGIILADSYSRNGRSQTWNLLLSEMDAQLKVLARLETYSDNADACPPVADAEPCWAYSSEGEFVPGENAEFYDIVVTTSGTRLSGEEVVSFEETARFVFVDGEYQLVDE